MKHLKYIYTAIALAFTQAGAVAAPSILDIKHSISDSNIVPPESFETASRQLEENFYIKNFTAPAAVTGTPHKGNAEEYEKLLSRLPAEIEMPYNSVVGSYINMYLDRKRTLVSDMLALHDYYGKYFIEELIKEGLPLELQYLPVIESALNPNAVSRAGAAGLWQFMPATATGLGMEVNSLVDERRDPIVSSKNAARYLKQLYNIYGDWSLAIAAYNCGPGNVNKALRKAGGGKLDFWEIYNYLPAETRGYVPCFIAANYVMNYHNRYGIQPTVVKQRLVTDTIQVADRVHFNQISQVLQIPVEEIRMLNPQYRKDVIPGDNHPYTLVLPSQQCLSYLVSRDAILAYDADLYARRTNVEPGVMRVPDGVDNALMAVGQTQNADSNVVAAPAVAPVEDIVNHLVGRGESLRDIARHYGVSSTDIKRWNNLRRGKVREGDTLAIRIQRQEVAEASVAPTTESTVTEHLSTANVAAQADAAVKAPKAKAKEKKKESKPKTTTYTVKSGDTLERLARKNGTTVEAIQKANSMSKGTTRIAIGQKIKIPTSGSGAGSSKKKGKRRR